LLEGEETMKFALIGLIALSGMAWAAPDLNDDFASLKEAVAGNDAAKVKTLAPSVSKQSREIVTKATESADVIEFAKGADDYADYALAVAAVKASDPKATVELGDVLLAQNNKSKYVDTMAGTYLAALSKEGGAKAAAGATKILAGRPENEDALYYAMASNSANAGKLVAVMSKKSKPEGMSDADWNSKKEAYLGAGYFYGGAAACGAQRWAECERNMKAAEPLMKGGQLGSTYFYLGLADYQLGTLTQDRTKLQAALKYSQQSAAIAGPNQGQASQNVAAMSKQLGGGTAKR
jgi:hypothetical protein